MSNLHNQLATAERDEVARGVRLLLRHPLLLERTDPDDFDLVRRRSQPLIAWFDYTCGWTLIVEPRLGYARLTKVTSGADATRPARRLRSGRAPFDRRRYTLLCVVAAELLTSPVTTIGLLADRVTQACAADDVLPEFDSSNRNERMAFVDVLRLIESMGAIEVLDGSSDSFVESTTAKVLYRVDPALLIRLLAAPTGASTLGVPASEVTQRFDELIGGLLRERRYGTRAATTDDEPGGEPAATEFVASSTQRTLWLRHSILRRLFDNPVVYRDDLSPAELEYLGSPTGRQILRRSAEQAGFLLEERVEGFLLIDPDGIATDSKFPDDASNAKVAGLLLLDRLCSAPGGVLSDPELDAVMQDILRQFPRWAKGYQTDDGVSRLVHEAVAVLSSFGLARRAADRLTSLPAATRYALVNTGEAETGARS
jgi:uncharacterized protein (TIGR02678 family)